MTRRAVQQHLAAALCLTLVGSLAAKSIYFVGNSVSDGIHYAGLKQLAESNGYTHVWGRDMIPGAPLHIHWYNPEVGIVEQPYGHWPQAFANYQWDAISLQHFDCALNGTDAGSIDACDSVNTCRFIDRIRQNPANRSTAIYIMGHIPRTTWAGTTADEWAAYWNRDSKDPATYGWNVPSCWECADYWRELTLAVRHARPGVTVQMIPCGHVFAKLNDWIRQGRITGYNSIVDMAYIPNDAIHTNEIGCYINGLTYYAVLYNADPRGAGTAGYPGVSSQLATTIQNAVWEVLNDPQLRPLIYGENVATMLQPQRRAANRSQRPAGGAVFTLRGERLDPARPGVSNGVTLQRPTIGMIQLRVGGLR